MFETIPLLQGSQLALLIYMALELSQIKRALKDSDAVKYNRPALFDEFIPVKRK